MMRRLLSGCLCLWLAAAAAWLPPVSASAPASPGALTSHLRRALDTLPPGQKLSVIVHLTNWAARLSAPGQAGLVRALRQHADAAQTPIRAWLRVQEAEGRVSNVIALWIINGLALTASREVILELAARPDVATVTVDEARFAPHAFRPSLQAQPVNDNLTLIGAPEAWARGVTGQGIVVAVLDSGVDFSHPDLKTRWRGGKNSWFDPYGESPEAPIDLNGHGTQVAGVILGGDAGGAPIGVAPGAQWIAGKVFDVRGRATASAIHQVLQWVLDPDGDPATADAPHVVNSSWATVIGLCNDEFSEDLRALRAAGILPVFAAGVDGQTSPANTLDAFAVSALTDAETLSSDSPSGPSVCADKPVFPQVVAPTGNVHTSDLFSTYVTLDEGGTSMAAAHVSGALALLLSAKSGLSTDEQAAVLTETAVDLGEPGPDNMFGYGRINIAAALDRLLGPDPIAQATAAASLQPNGNDTNPATLPIVLVGLLTVVIAVGLVVLWRRRQSSARR